MKKIILSLSAISLSTTLTSITTSCYSSYKNYEKTFNNKLAKKLVNASEAQLRPLIANDSFNIDSSTILNIMKNGSAQQYIESGTKNNVSISEYISSYFSGDNFYDKDNLDNLNTNIKNDQIKTYNSADGGEIDQIFNYLGPVTGLLKNIGTFTPGYTTLISSILNLLPSIGSDTINESSIYQTFNDSDFNSSISSILYLLGDQSLLSSVLGVLTSGYFIGGITSLDIQSIINSVGVLASSLSNQTIKNIISFDIYKNALSSDNDKINQIGDFTVSQIRKSALIHLNDAIKLLTKKSTKNKFKDDSTDPTPFDNSSSQTIAQKLAENIANISANGIGINSINDISKLINDLLYFVSEFIYYGGIIDLSSFTPKSIDQAKNNLYSNILNNNDYVNGLNASKWSTYDYDSKNLINNLANAFGSNANKKNQSVNFGLLKLFNWFFNSGINIDDYSPTINNLLTDRTQRISDKNLSDDTNWLGFSALTSGLIYGLIGINDNENLLNIVQNLVLNIIDEFCINGKIDLSAAIEVILPFIKNLLPDNTINLINKILDNLKNDNSFSLLYSNVDFYNNIINLINSLFNTNLNTGNYSLQGLITNKIDSFLSNNGDYRFEYSICDTFDKMKKYSDDFYNFSESSFLDLNSFLSNSSDQINAFSNALNEIPKLDRKFIVYNGINVNSSILGKNISDIGNFVLNYNNNDPNKYIYGPIGALLNVVSSDNTIFETNNDGTIILNSNDSQINQTIITPPPNNSTETYLKGNNAAVALLGGNSDGTAFGDNTVFDLLNKITASTNFKNILSGLILGIKLRQQFQNQLSSDYFNKYALPDAYKTNIDSMKNISNENCNIIYEIIPTNPITNKKSNYKYKVIIKTKRQYENAADSLLYKIDSVTKEIN